MPGTFPERVNNWRSPFAGSQTGWWSKSFWASAIWLKDLRTRRDQPLNVPCTWLANSTMRDQRLNCWNFFRG